MIHLIKKIDKIEPFKIRLLFNTGEYRTVDFTEKLAEWSASKNSKYVCLLDPEYFLKVNLNTELETIFWDNGIDFCPDVLYGWSN